MKPIYRHIRILAICILLLTLTNCQKDDDIKSSSNHQSKPNIDIPFTLNSNSFKKFNENAKFSDALKSFSRQGSGVSNINAKSAIEEEHGFTIDSTEIKEVITENYTTYTFYIQRDSLSSQEYFENLVLKIDSTNITKAYIIKYILNSEGTYVYEHDSKTMDAIVEILEIDYDTNQLKVSADCVAVLMCPWSADGTWSPHPAGFACIAAGRGDLYFDTSGCVDISAGNYNPSGDGGGAGGFNTPGSGPVITAPIDIQPWQEVVNCMNTLSSAQDTSSLTTEMVIALQNDKTFANQIDNFLDQNNCSDEAQISVLIEFESQSNPFILLEIDCDQIEHWQVLAQNEASEEIKNKIDSLPGTFFNDFEIQPIEDANGSIVNMDYFPVKITTLPTNPSTGQQFTADEFLDYFRRNINVFTDGGGTTFEPYCENVSPSICQQETDLWNSNNPTGAIIYLDIISDDGVVICSEYENDYWYFMTMNAPYAGNHPVSGTRQFGYELNADGSYNFFVRGVDRFNSFIQSDVAQAFSGVDPFLAADAMWYAFQTNMNNFVNNNGGNSTIGLDVKNRPDWNKVKDVLLGNRPISDLGCN